MSDPRITDEMVAKAERAWNAAWLLPIASPGRLDWMRAALEAALPLIAPQPVDRDALSAELDAHIWKSWQRQGHLMAGCTCGWKDVDRGRLYSSAWRWHRLDAVLALVNGEATS